MAKKIVVALLIISIGFNLYLLYDRYMKFTYSPNYEDQEILGEMTMMVLASEDYKNIATKEKVYAIHQTVNRFNVRSPYAMIHYEVLVKTDKQTYYFTCQNKRCDNVDVGGWSYSRYSEEPPILPLNKDE